MNSTDFLLKKNEITSKLMIFKKEYEEFLKEVSPKNWRSSGHHCHELREMYIDIQSFTQITEEEKNIDWVKTELEK